MTGWSCAAADAAPDPRTTVLSHRDGAVTLRPRTADQGQALCTSTAVIRVSHDALDGVPVAGRQRASESSLQHPSHCSCATADEASDAEDVAISCGKCDCVASWRGQWQIESDNGSSSERDATLVNIIERRIYEGVGFDLLS